MSESSKTPLDMDDPFSQVIVVALDTRTDTVTVRLHNMSSLTAKTILDQVCDQFDTVTSNLTITMIDQNNQQIDLPSYEDEDQETE
jgi:hypothetical protein